MIVVLSGTSEGRKSALLLLEAGFDVAATAVSRYGAELLRESGVEKVLEGELDDNELENLLSKGVAAVLDATHPYSVNISRAAIRMCAERKVPYIRLERPSSDLPSHPLVKKVQDLDEALEAAVSEGSNLFSAIGSRKLPELVKKAEKRGVHLTVRVLPDPEVVSGCIKLGLKPSQIIAAQGPFGCEFNREMFRSYDADVVLTKESGESGGVREKIYAAVNLGVPVVVWMRPRLKYPAVVNSAEEAVREIKRRWFK